MTSPSVVTVGVVMGSSSDWDTLQHAVQILQEFGIAHEARVISAHRMPDDMFVYAQEAAGRGLKGGPQASIYSAAKAAIIVFSQSVAQEVGKHGVRVNTIAPGNAEARWKKPSAEDTRSPLGRATSADDVGKAVAFLLSDDAAHITGSCLDISGGTSLH